MTCHYYVLACTGSTNPYSYLEYIHMYFKQFIMTHMLPLFLLTMWMSKRVYTPFMPAQCLPNALMCILYTSHIHVYMFLKHIQ